MNRNQKGETDLEVKVKAIQRIIASVVGSIVIVITLSYTGWVTVVFPGGEIKSLESFREYAALCGLSLACLIGIGSILWMGGKIIEFKQNYQELTEFKKEQDKEK